MIPNSILGSFGSLATGFIVRATGRYYWLTIFCGGFSIISAILLAGWDKHTSELSMWTSFCPMAFAMGSVTTLTIVALIADIGRDHVAVATSRRYRDKHLSDCSVVHFPHYRPGSRRVPIRSTDPGSLAEGAEPPNCRPRGKENHLTDSAVLGRHQEPGANISRRRDCELSEGAACGLCLCYCRVDRRCCGVSWHSGGRYEGQGCQQG